MKNKDLLAVRSYVTAYDGPRNYQSVAVDTVICDVTHSNLQQRHIEIRLDKSQPLSSLRRKIHLSTGTPPEFQHLHLFNGESSSSSNNSSIPFNEITDTYPIGYFIHEHGWTIHVQDTNEWSLSAGRALEDVSLVPKFKLSDSAYEAKSNTLRRWKQDQQALDPSFTLQSHATKHAALLHARQCARLGLPLPPGFEQVPVPAATAAAAAESSPSSTVSTTGSNTENKDIAYAATTMEIRAIPIASGTDADASSTFGPNENERDKTNTSSSNIIKLGARCQVEIGKRRGTVAWVGQLVMPMTTPSSKNTNRENASNSINSSNSDLAEVANNNNSNDDDNTPKDCEDEWVGVLLDEPVGRNNGTLHNIFYFEAPPMHGAFVKRHGLQIGDFAPRDILDDDDDDDSDDDEI